MTALQRFYSFCCHHLKAFIMRQTFIYCLVLILLIGCKKENASKVDIYMLKSFTVNVDPTVSPAPMFSNVVLADTPLVADEDIRFYTISTTTFTLKKDIQSVIMNYGADKAFAVTVDDEPVYFGIFHPMYLNSIPIGVAMIVPFSYKNNELEITFSTIEGNSDLKKLDKRNDKLITRSLMASGRIR